MASEHESLDQQRWAELKALFGEILELPPNDWPPFVERIRDRDAGLAVELQRLLDGHADSLIQLKTGRLDHLTPGITLGPYVLTGMIGEGGMGQVYRAKDERLGREVAIKVLPPDLTRDPDRRARMEREARAMGMLNHPNIVTVYDIGDHQGSPFIVSELLEGQTLRDRMVDAAGSGGRIPAPEAADIVTSVADALGAAHRRGIVHRDIKPENIFLTTDGRIKVLDFGIAKLLDGESAGSGTVVGAMIGTLSYMAPEQVRGESASAESDVYAAGVVLYELLSGAHPYAGRSQTALIGAILHEQPAPLVGVPPALTALVVRCLDKRTDARIADGAALATELRSLPAVDPLANTSRRRYLVASAIVLLAGVAIGSVLWRQQPDEGVSEAPANGVGADIALPAPASPSSTPAPPSGGRETPSPTRGVGPPVEGSSRADGQRGARPQASSTIESSAPQPPPVSPTPPVAAPLTGVWTFNEQMREDVHAIECAAAGALQLKFDDGVLDGTLRMKRDCTDTKKRSTDSTESAAALSAGSSTGDVVSFVTRVVDEGLATTCRYSGKVVGSAKETATGEVTCEARSEGLAGVLTLRGSWRAKRTSP